MPTASSLREVDMHIGSQIQAPKGLGSLRAGERYYYGGRTGTGDVLLIWFHETKEKRWRPAFLHVSGNQFEDELIGSPPGLVLCERQYSLPPATEALEGINFDELGRTPQEISKDQARVEFRLQSILNLLDREQDILTSSNPLKFISKLGRDSQSRVHPWDLQYWFFCYVMHGRSRWALSWSTHMNGTWARDSEEHRYTKFGRPSSLGPRKGWPVAPMAKKISEIYLRDSGLGISMRAIFNAAIITDFGCDVISEANGTLHIVHPENEPFPTYGQFRDAVVKRFGLKNVQTAKYGAARMDRTAAVDKSNTTGNLSNLMERVEIDAYRCAERPSSRTGEVMPELVVARAICCTSGARIGIGFSLGGESGDAYRAMCWSMAVPKSLVAEAYGIPVKRLDWPMHGMSRMLLSDRGPGGQAALISELSEKCPFKSITGSYKPKGKPNVESSNPRSTDPEGAPTYVQSELQVGSLMKQEVLRAASENRTSSILPRLTPEMIVDFHRLGLPATPESLWKYLGQRMRTNSVKMTEDEAVRAFLRSSKVAVDRVGFISNRLHYNSTAVRESGLHEALIHRNVTEVTAYTLSLVARLIWVEIDGRLHRLEAQQRLLMDDEELFVSIGQLEDLAKIQTELGARTRHAADAARSQFVKVAVQVTGQAPGIGRRRAGRPGRGKGSAAAEAAVLKRNTERKFA